MRRPPHAGHVARLSSFGLLIAGLLALLTVGCRRGMPVIDPTGSNPDAHGTISGTVRAPESGNPIEGRVVEVVNVESGERQRTTTSNTGGFTFKVRPGRYRVSVALLAGESILKQPGVLEVNRSDVDAFADFVIGGERVLKPRLSAPANPSLGTPIG